MKGGTRKLRKGRGPTTRTHLSRSAKTKTDAIMHDIKPVATIKKTKKKIEKDINNIVEKQLDFKLERPKFKSILAGELYKYFFSQTNLGPFKLFDKLKNDFKGQTIPISFFEGTFHKETCEKVKNTIKLLQEDLELLEKIPKDASSKLIPTNEDDISKLLGNFSLAEH